MRIKRLDISGFKSFMAPSSFRFDEGITGIVGPNGCGKSNVVDAIRWVMGEQSAKHLRGRGMEDVIFSGSEFVAALSLAEVSLTFSVGPDDLLAPPYAGFPEITLTRRLFRSGESEYLINKTPCRLLDITELFLGTGVGTRAYSIIEQGRVGLIVSAKPEDRRALIEEAAGVTKYKARRKAAERKMEATQANLLRVSDVVAELEKQLDSLSRQAKKAEKYKRLRQEMRDVELKLASQRYLEVRAQATLLKEQIDALGKKEQGSLEKVRALEEAICVKRGQIEVEGQALQALQDQVHSLESQLKLDLQNVAHWAADLDETRQRLDKHGAEATDLTGRQGSLEEELERKQREFAQAVTRWKEGEVEVGVAEEELRRAGHAHAQMALSLEQERATMVEVAARLANAQTKLAGLSERREELERERANNQERLGDLRAREQELDKARGEVARRAGEIRQSASDLSERRGAEEESLAAARQEFAENEVAVIAMREGLADQRSRLASLKEIQKNYEGYDRGVRAVLRRGGDQEREAGVWGVVSDVISTTPRFEKAIEAVLGERLQHVVVDSQEKGFELMEFLRSISEGRSSFVPVAATRAVGRPPEPDLSAPGVVAPAMAEVRCEAPLWPLVRALLGDVVVMGDLDSAKRYAKVGGAGLTLVTLEGEVLRPDGSMTGGLLEGPAIGALRKKREIAELEAEVSLAEARYNEALTRHYSLQKRMGQSEGVLKGLQKNQHREELALAGVEKDLEAAAQELVRVREELGRLDRDDEELFSRLASLQNEMESVRGEAAHAQADQGGRQASIAEMERERDRAKERVEALTVRLTELRVRAAANQERQESARKECEKLRDQNAELAERLVKLAQLEDEAKAKVEELIHKSQETQKRCEERQRVLAEAAMDLDLRRKELAESVSRVREDEASVKELREGLDELSEGLSQLSLTERELTLELGHLVDQIQEKYQVDLRYEISRFHLLPLSGQEAETRLKELRAQVERMGEINLTAIEEHTQLSERFSFLSGQKKDLEASLEQLKGAITKINRTSRERFEETFEVINQKFQQVFPRLFGGGRAGLVLTEEAPGIEAGVEIIAQPPGKKLQSVSLLSGGEKALTAVSLIFAIFLIKPTPFCLLDEVDAPLDDANVDRYNEMVKEMAKGSQFILITHNKRTMEVADTLYGVTMEEPGISKLVSVKMRDAVSSGDERAA